MELSHTHSLFLSLFLIAHQIWLIGSAIRAWFCEMERKNKTQEMLFSILINTGEIKVNLIILPMKLRNISFNQKMPLLKFLAKWAFFFFSFLEESQLNKCTSLSHCDATTRTWKQICRKKNSCFSKYNIWKKFVQVHIASQCLTNLNGEKSSRTKISVKQWPFQEIQRLFFFRTENSNSPETSDSQMM